MKTREWYAAHLKELLDEREMTEKQLAELLGVHPVSVTRWIHGTSKIAYPSYIKLIEILGDE